MLASRHRTIGVPQRGLYRQWDLGCMILGLTPTSGTRQDLITEPEDATIALAGVAHDIGGEIIALVRAFWVSVDGHPVVGHAELGVSPDQLELDSSVALFLHEHAGAILVCVDREVVGKVIAGVRIHELVAHEPALEGSLVALPGDLEPELAVGVAVDLPDATVALADVD